MSKFIYCDDEWNKVIINGSLEKRVHGDGQVVFMCPHCLHMVETHINSAVFVGDKILDKVNNFIVNQEFHGECPNCKEYTPFEVIDINMAQIIKILNDKGYYTAFSCEGHIEQEDISAMQMFGCPYIYFYFDEDMEILESHPLPETWSIDDINVKIGIFEIHDNILKSVPEEVLCHDDHNVFISWMRDNWDKEKRLEDIYNWADSLPDRDDEFKKFKFALSKTYGNMLLIENMDKRQKYTTVDDQIIREP